MLRRREGPKLKVHSIWENIEKLDEVTSRSVPLFSRPTFSSLPFFQHPSPIFPLFLVILLYPFLLFSCNSYAPGTGCMCWTKHLTFLDRV